MWGGQMDSNYSNHCINPSYFLSLSFPSVKIKGCLSNQEREALTWEFHPLLRNRKKANIVSLHLPVVFPVFLTETVNIAE